MLPVSENDLQVIPLCYEEMMIAVDREHPLARKRALSIKDLTTLPFILYERKTVMLKTIDNSFAGLGVTPRVVMMMENLEAIKSLVGAGLGASVLPEHAVGDEEKDAKVRLMRVAGHQLHRHLGLIRLKSGFIPAVVSKMIKLILSELASVPRNTP